MPSPTTVLLSFMRHFRWAHVGIISSAEEVWVETASKVAIDLRYHGMPVGIVASVSNDPLSMRRTLAKVKKVDDLRMVILCMHSVLIGGETQSLLLQTAYDMRMMEGSLVFVPYDTLLYSLPYRDVRYPALRNNSKLIRAYDAMLTVTLESGEMSFYQAYQEAMDRGELPGNIKPLQVSPLFGTIYNSIMFMANAMQNLHNSGAWLSGGNLAHHTRSMSFNGFNQHIHTNCCGASLVEFVVLDTDGHSWELHPTHRVDMETGLLRVLGRSIHFPQGVSPKTDSSCWFTHGIICTGGVDPVSAIMILLTVLCMSACLLGLFYIIRRRINQIRMVRGPNRIMLTLADVTFINPSLSNKKMSIDDSRASEGRRSYSEADRSLKSPYSASTLHENINPFLGFFHDCDIFAIVTEFCSRGSMEDLLQNEDVKLDWMFKSSLLLDLIKVGMKYLHHRNVSHGRLKSRNCIVDGRFVLKVTDYGYNEVLEAQKFPYVEPPAEELLWTAPEILRNAYPGLTGTLPGDVYSFSIIMQEVVMRGPPFCMLELSAQDLIQKIKKPPPLCRPVVSPDHAPMECIQLMKQCWNEQPERRPNFEEIFDQFKNINKGKKTNIIDSMLRMLEQYSSNLEDLIRERTEELEPEYFDNVTLYFSDIVGFTTISANSEPIEVVDLLNDLYTLFDAIIGDHDVYKVETIGDAYMVASGLPVPNENRHAAEISNMALDILSAVGTTVKILLDLKAGYKVQLRGRTDVKGKSLEETYWLIGKTGFTKPLPVPPELKSGPEVNKDFKVVLQKAVKRLSHVQRVTQIVVADDDNVMMHHH
ncbi:hypothetical protein JZ751_018705 [Albula glossodonta]|uniref:guanylate cyclase n=1 Tax=Albula glossodonta TaxID=121402 RepID=A0A8T2NVM5_9TELE|nr:hypothetical protein JZ751_018705 [Albula glossodonta]